MTTSLIRNLTIIAATAVIVPMLLSAPAFAGKKSITQGGLASIVKHFDDFCAGLQNTYNSELAAAGKSSGGTADAHGHMANQAYMAASQGGCGWAS